ncbi:MAG: hypothetical protein HQK96_18605 [Nitrospirae bacterium]|nr:hypothetical protein [Nitrospirota bacterium]
MDNSTTKCIVEGSYTAPFLLLAVFWAAMNVIMNGIKELNLTRDKVLFIENKVKDENKYEFKTIDYIKILYKSDWLTFWWGLIVGSQNKVTIKGVVVSE